MDLQTNSNNLDYQAAKYAQNIINNAILDNDKDDIDNLVTKTLGVLQENGVYASMLFLLSRSNDKEKKIASTIQKELIDLAFVVNPSWANLNFNRINPAKILAFYSDQVTLDLHNLLLIFEVYEQTLIYARYGAKACVEKEPAKPQGG